MPRFTLAHAVAIVIAVASLIVAIANGGTTIVRPQASAPQVQAQLASVQAKAANVTPNAACNPAVGHGSMGVCAPAPGPLAALVVPQHAKATSVRAIHGILGVDVSNNQGCGYRVPRAAFLFVKLNEGAYFRDGCAAGFAHQGFAHSMKVGGYDFLRAGHSSASGEAHVFVDQYRAAHLSGPAVADVEVNDRGVSPVGMRAYVNAWALYVKAHLPRATIMIYTGKWFWDPQVNGAAGTSNLWISAYASTYYLPLGFKSALIWQYADGRFGPYPHIGGVDSNVFLGSRARFDAVFASSKPISAGMRRRCRELNTLRRHSRRYHRHYHLRPVPPLSAKRHARAKAIIAGERRRGVVCKVGPPGKRGTIRRK
jgi:GH25 family lysozyme M1 (1,4-beta-N-acetylmuramidase)